MEIDIFTLFPEAFDWYRSQRHITNAVALGHRLQCVNYRDHTPLSGGQVDDTPFGGGAGMVLRIDVVEAALRARYAVDPVTLGERRRVIALEPGGRLLDDRLADELGAAPALTLLCGRYEVCDTVVRKLPGALGDERSAVEESFSEALEGGPEYPHYTRPAEHRGWPVPEILLSGHHARIAQWRLERSRERSAALRAGGGSGGCGGTGDRA